MATKFPSLGSAFALGNDAELLDWVLNLEKMNAGSFLRAIGDAAKRADIQNYHLMRPLLLKLKHKYPDYARPYDDGSASARR